MMGTCVATPWKREHRRIPVESLCTELDDHQMRHSLVVDLSETGLRIQRPIGGWMPRDLQLEFEIPEVDEIVWARGRIAFDEVWKVPAGLVRTTGIEILSSAVRHRRMLRELVNDTWRQIVEPEDDWMLRAACYLYG